jgi:cystathionine beta-lyase/cystathionine gamma-synthase
MNRMATQTSRSVRNLCKSAGPTFSFEVKGGEAEAFAVLDRLEVIKLAVSLGGTETLLHIPRPLPIPISRVRSNCA